MTRPYDSIVNIIEETKDIGTLDAQEVMASLKAFKRRFERHVDAATKRVFKSLSVNPRNGSSIGQYNNFKQQNKKKEKLRNGRKPKLACEK